MRNFLIRSSVLIFLVSANVFIWTAEAGNKELTVAFLDIGQGDSIFIEAPNGTQVLIDGGRGRQILRALGNVMPLSDRSIDVVIATHPDADHVGGLIDVFDRYDIGMFLEPGVIGDTKTWETLEQRVSDEELAPVLARRGMKLSLDKNVFLYILFPDRNVSHVETNSGSIVTRLVYGDSSFIFTGDAPQDVENYLAKLDGENLQSDVLKVGHHGSRTSSSRLFVSIVAPQYGIISAGENNSYGHPHLEVLDILSDFDVEILKTYEIGNIIFTSNGGEPVLKN
jgi:competence protein ComEC